MRRNMWRDGLGADPVGDNALTSFRAQPFQGRFVQQDFPGKFRSGLTAQRTLLSGYHRRGFEVIVEASHRLGLQAVIARWLSSGGLAFNMRCDRTAFCRKHRDDREACGVGAKEASGDEKGPGREIGLAGIYGGTLRSCGGCI
jgi:hypothetical protein